MLVKHIGDYKLESKFHQNKVFKQLLVYYAFFERDKGQVFHTVESDKEILRHSFGLCDYHGFSTLRAFIGELQ